MSEALRGFNQKKKKSKKKKCSQKAPPWPSSCSALQWPWGGKGQRADPPDALWWVKRRGSSQGNSWSFSSSGPETETDQCRHSPPPNELMAQPGYCLIGLLVMLTGPRVKQAYCRGGDFFPQAPGKSGSFIQKLRMAYSFVCLFIHLFVCGFSPHSLRIMLRFDEMMSVTFLLYRQSATDEGNPVLPRGSRVCC